MSDYYAPTVTIDGKPLDVTREVRGVTVLSGLEMTWGCEDWLSPVDPGKLTLRLLDPRGELLPLVGATSEQPITITRVDGVVWEGYLSDAEAELVTLPNLGTEPGIRHVYEVTVTAYDELGRLAADRKHGPIPNDITTLPRGQTHWGPDSMRGRRRGIAARTRVPIRFMEPTGFGSEESMWAVDGKFAPMAGYEKQQNVSVLSVLHRTMRSVNSLNRPYYSHTRREISEVMPPQVSRFTGITVVDVGGVINLAQYGDGQLSSVALLDGGRFTADNGVRIVANPATRITTVERTGRREKVETNTAGQPSLTYEEDTQQIMTGVEQREVCTASFETDLSSEWWQRVAPIRTWANPDWWQDLYTKTGPGVLSHVQPVRDAADPDALLDLLRPEPVVNVLEYGDPTTPAYAYQTMLTGYALTRSLTNLVPNSHEFAILGGTLSYDAQTGWRHDLTTAPTGRIDAPLPRQAAKLRDVTTSAKIGNARPGITVADLTRITHPVTI